MRHIYRASFARFTIVRESIKTPNKCFFCGNTKKGGSLYVYHVHNDGGSSDTISGEFCSADCCRSYNDINKKWNEG